MRICLSDRFDDDLLFALAFLHLFPRLDAGPGGLTAVAEAKRVIAGFDDVAVMREAIEQGGRELGIDEDAGPFGKDQVGGDDDAGKASSRVGGRR